MFVDYLVCFPFGHAYGTVVGKLVVSVVLTCVGNVFFVIHFLNS